MVHPVVCKIWLPTFDTFQFDRRSVTFSICRGLCLRPTRGIVLGCWNILPMFQTSNCIISTFDAENPAKLGFQLVGLILDNASNKESKGGLINS